MPERRFACDRPTDKRQKMADKKTSDKKPQPVELIASCKVAGILYGQCFDAANNVLYGGGADSSVYRVDLNAKEPNAEKSWTHHDNYVSSLAWTDGVVVSSGYDRRLVWTDAASDKTTRVIEDAHDAWIRDVAVTTDGRKLVSVADDMRVKVWDARTGALLHSMEGHQQKTPQGFATALYVVSISADGKMVASGDRIGDVCLWDIDTGKLVRRFQASGFYTYDSVKRSRSIGGIRSVCFSPDGTRIALSGIGAVTNVDGFVGPVRVEVWDTKTAKRVFTVEDNHKAVLNHVAFHPTLPLVVAGGGGDSGGFLGVWNTDTRKLVHKAKPKGHLQRFTIDAEHDRVLAAGHDGFQIWKASFSELS